MLGVVEYEGMGPADVLLKEYAEEIGVGETFTNTKVGVFFDKPGVEVADPYFEGEGPAGPAACAAAAAWSAAATAPRTR